MIISNFPGSGGSSIKNALKVNATASGAISKGDSVYMTLSNSIYTAHVASSGIIASLSPEITYYIGFALSNISSGSSGSVNIVETITAISDITDYDISLINSISTMVE